jgi:thymidylate synthase (FAD)
MALNAGIAKEQARALLPEGLTETTLYMAGTLRSWIHYCELRRGHGTQKEHIKIADRCWDIIAGHFPEIAEALDD